MKTERIIGLGAAVFAAVLSLNAAAATGVQVGASGRTYASTGIKCGMHPVNGMSPYVQAGLYNPKRTDTATVSVNGTAVAIVNFITPDSTAWLVSGANNVGVSLSKRLGDSYAFDASPAYPGQPNACIPDTRGNSVSADLEYAASLKSYANVTSGCALNPATGRAQPYVNLFANGTYLLNVSVNNVPLTQLNGTTRPRALIFLAAGLNVISAANGAASIDYFVRNGGSGSCSLP